MQLNTWIKNSLFFSLFFQKLEEFPDALQKVTGNLRNLDLSQNKIVSIPRWISSFKVLKTLNISSNKITQLPEEIGDLIKLENLLVSGNLLRALPRSLGKFFKAETQLTVWNNVKFTLT